MLDELDIKILEELQKNGRATYVELKKKLGVEDTTIRKRIMRMEKEGIIEGYTVEINPEALGYTITSFIGIDTAPNLTEVVAEKLCNLKGVVYVFESTGSYDLFTSAVVRDMNEFGKIVDEIKNTEGVLNVDVEIATKWFKRKKRILPEL